MPPVQPAVFGAVALLLVVGVGAQSPVLPGLRAGHGLSPAAVGEVLFDELRCAACHGDLALGVPQPPPAPDLENVGWRVAPDHLLHFIAAPQAVHPGTTMPGLLDTLPTEERDEVAEALTHFLVGRAPEAFSGRITVPAEIERGAGLFHRVGCVACHGALRSVFEGDPPPQQRAGDVRLDHVPDKYSVESLSAFLFDPLHVRAAGRMPDMGLDHSEAGAIAQYLIGPMAGGSDAAQPAAFTVRPELAEAGARHFTQLGCASCHPLAGLPSPAVAAPGALRDFWRGCLSPDDTATPRYHLDGNQITAVRAYLARKLYLAEMLPDHEPTTAERIEHTLATFNCLACHERDGRGGVAKEIDPYFETTEPDLGDHARIPPSLTLVGAKLRSEWFRKVLFDGASVRPYMTTRMPQFGAANVGPLPALFAEIDHIAPFEVPKLEGDAARAARDGGRVLLGTDGLGCITCHNFNGKRSPAHHGIDLINTCERLQPGWFAAFLISPQSLRPGIVMPESWPGGTATHDSILGGDTSAQISGIWSFLAQGRTARDPQGLVPRPSQLHVTDRVRTYRGRSGIAGFRGIAVGFPNGVSYAFDATNGTLCGLWSGEFISVRWDGQGAGDFRVSERPVRLARDVSFVRLESDSAPWPLRPRTDKDHPVNPDPLYPRNHGYRFRGYFFDESGTPTFMFESGTLSIEDRSTGRADGERRFLDRVLRITAPDDQTVWFRALAGEFEELAPNVYQLGRLKLRIPEGPSLVRPLPAPATGAELLLQLTVPAGTSEWRLEYEILP